MEVQPLIVVWSHTVIVVSHRVVVVSAVLDMDSKIRISLMIDRIHAGLNRLVAVQSTPTVLYKNQ